MGSYPAGLTDVLLKYEPGILINIYNLPKNFTGYQARKYSVPVNTVNGLLTSDDAQPGLLSGTDKGRTSTVIEFARSTKHQSHKFAIRRYRYSMSLLN